MIEKKVKVVSGQILRLSMVIMVVSAGMLILPISSFGSGAAAAQISINIDFSPNIINLQSEREGQIRILTSMRYSLWVADGHSIFIYFNGSDSVPNIRPSRDSLGNLILRFSLEDLLGLKDPQGLSPLKPNEFNDVQVVVCMTEGDEHIGETTVYLSLKGK